MSSAADRPTGPLDNHLGWQSWQLDLPAEWNPARLSGNARAGTVIAADLERVRLELSWRRVRSVAGVDLSRAARARRRDSLTWRADACRGEGIADSRRAVTDNGDVLALLLSAASRRLLFVKVAGTPGGAADPTADRLLASIGDASRRASVPWCVYGFAWSVPAGFQLTGHRFAAGRAVLTFRHRRQSLTFERWVLAGTGPTEGTGPADGCPAGTLDHNGHEVRMVRPARRKPWHRIVSGEAWRAEWICETSNRGYRLEAAGPDAARLLEAAIPGVNCHLWTSPRF